MARNYSDWLPAFIKYASHTEAPKIMHFFAGVGAIAGALRKRVWIDRYYWKWTPNFFILFVAPAGIVAKSSTADIAIDLLKDVPGIKFGPDIVTWQALATAFANASESFEFEGAWHPMSPITILASELGNLLNPKDKELVNLLITLWDGRKTIDKQTKMSGNDLLEAPWANIIGCTTPSWIEDNIPRAIVGGGLWSRALTIYADEKAKFVANPRLQIEQLGLAAEISESRIKLVQDLEYISLNLVGEYKHTREADAWEKAWYEHLWKQIAPEDEHMNTYKARKQTHLNKLAMVLAASARDELIITIEDLQLAETMLTTIEADMPKVFSKIGRTDDSLMAERFIDFVRRRGSVPYADAYREVHRYFPDAKVFEGIMSGAIRAGYLALETRADGFHLTATNIVPLKKEAS